MKFTVEEIAKAYLSICDCFCEGDPSVGIYPCNFYVPSDIYDGVSGGGYCGLKEYVYQKYIDSKNTDNN